MAVSASRGPEGFHLGAVWRQQSRLFSQPSARARRVDGSCRVAALDLLPRLRVHRAPSPLRRSPKDSAHENDCAASFPRGRRASAAVGTAAERSWQVPRTSPRGRRASAAVGTAARGGNRGERSKRSLSGAKSSGILASNLFIISKLAEREGFEPSIEFPLYTLSKRAPSTTRPSLRWAGQPLHQQM